MAENPIYIDRKQISIYMQVVLKEWCVLNKRLPSGKIEWDTISSCAKNLWKQSEMAANHIESVVKPGVKIDTFLMELDATAHLQPPLGGTYEEKKNK